MYSPRRPTCSAEHPLRDRDVVRGLRSEVLLEKPRDHGSSLFLHRIGCPHFAGACEVLLGTIALAPLLLQGRTRLQGDDILGVEAKGLIQRLQRVLGSLQLLEGIPPVQVGAAVVGLEPDRLAIVLDPCGDLSALDPHRAPGEEGQAQQRIEPYGLVVVGERVFVLPEVVPAEPPIEVGVGVARLELDGLVEAPERLLELAGVQPFETAIRGDAGIRLAFLRHEGGSAS
jgi:hypothetical protein